MLDCPSVRGRETGESNSARIAGSRPGPGACGRSLTWVLPNTDLAARSVSSNTRPGTDLGAADNQAILCHNLPFHTIGERRDVDVGRSRDPESLECGHQCPDEVRNRL